MCYLLCQMASVYRAASSARRGSASPKVQASNSKQKNKSVVAREKDDMKGESKSHACLTEVSHWGDAVLGPRN